VGRKDPSQQQIRSRNALTNILSKNHSAQGSAPLKNKRNSLKIGTRRGLSKRKEASTENNNRIE
jgi:hypothetical protein